MSNAVTALLRALGVKQQQKLSANHSAQTTRGSLVRVTENSSTEPKAIFRRGRSKARASVSTAQLSSLALSSGSLTPPGGTATS